MGFYENFPTNIHRIDRFTSILSSKQLQQKLIQVFFDVNRKEFSFEEVANPTVPEGKVIFEFGLAESEGFNYIDEEELKKTMNLLARERLGSMDFFCSIRYYRCIDGKKAPLKFDYYMLRAVFSKETFEVQVFHERGPRYISPEELTTFIFIKVNDASSRNKKILKKASI
ncbi:MAG TPA: hypothetical protein VK253_06955 [Candidatus Binatia bacterium]|nr:hypothetical protein [Candidatus Binatia bacterium]